MKTKSELRVTKDMVNELKESLRQLVSEEVMVGIPNTAGRNDGDFSNASIAYIAEHGSPGKNIPPRPFLTIGIHIAKEKLISEFANSARKILEQKRTVEEMYQRAGFIAVEQIKLVIDNQINLEKPKPSTLRARKRKGFMGESALLVTGQLRNAVTFVVRRKVAAE